MFSKSLLPTQARILLASSSPRRRELLKMIIPDFSIAESRDVIETYPDTLRPSEVSPYLSQLKANAYATDVQPGEIIITADTTVILDTEILGKPASMAEAVDMIMKMSGRHHLVVTGVTLMSAVETKTFAETTDVVFDQLSRQEAQLYVENFQPMDKAGAYGIQEWIGAAAISGIRGCFYNVMGLPLHSLYLHLKSLKY